MGNNVKYIGEAASHETGHTLGLYHEVLLNEAGNVVTPYNPGSGEKGSPLSWAPIMGDVYYNDLTTFSVGKTSSTNPQDCFATITRILPYKVDDCPAAFSKAKELSTTLEGYLEAPLDEDLYEVHASSLTLGVETFGNIDARVEVYNRQKTLLKVLDDPLGKNIPPTTITTGSRSLFIKVMASTTSPYTPREFMNGQYRLKVY